MSWLAGTSELGDRLRERAQLWRQVVRLLRYSSRRLSILVGLVTLLEAGLAILGLWLIKELIDALSAEDAMDAAGRVFGLLIATGLATLAALVTQAWGNLLRVRQGMLVADYVDREIHDRAVSVDLAFYESPAYFDSLQRARQAGTQRPAQMVATVLGLAKALVFLVGVLVLLAGIEWRLLPVLLVAVVSALAVRLYFTRRLYEWQRQRVQLERRAGYLDWLLTSDYHAKELRLHDLGAVFRDAYSDLRRRIRAEQLRIERARAFGEAGVSVVGAVVFVGAIAWLVMRTLAGTFSLGDIVLFVLLFRRAEQSGREAVNGLSRLYEDQLYLSQLFSFLAVEPQLTAPARPAALPEPVREGLRMEGVSFGYPGTDRQTLEGIDLHLPPGKLVALVGENGSGKTTLIKLMTRLYDPDAGRITLDGRDVRDFDPVDYRQLFSVIFQDFAKYAATVSDNVWYGDAGRPPDAARIRDAGRRAGADPFIASLPKGYETPLSRIFDDGQELSIGQWQRVALARAFLPETAFIVMDEPTSAVDPAAEMELFDTLRERIGGRGALIISHRLSTIRHVDYTYVLNRGRIAEHGTHDALLAADGRYADLFGRQAAYFQ
ncbi:ABC transporter ATP-binding protein [Roseitranquillus sediminis]|uniref:ABC transporter ATP-binding protein n=1 Tax=Roseitranquillus sediminis TaxID=2809051 RepID=UPI001D0C5F8B|nr:ABC transporter ATP-binding protein [Roseitranquillus sediminis]MBM9594027.1 ABC transporter ATP-binding protein [Roseitranquillus sediminis]